MTPFLKDWFGAGRARDLSDVPAFEARVCAVVRRALPDFPLEPSGHPLVLSGPRGARVSLQHLYAAHRESPASPADLEARILAHVGRLRSQPCRTAGEVAWAEARDRLRVQLLPRECRLHAPLLDFAFPSPRLVVGLVLDLEDGQAPVRPADAERWAVANDWLHQLALDNLDRATAEGALHATLDRNRRLVVQTMDGYDAARLLLPGVRQLIANRIGYPFVAAVPARDLLMAWAEDCEAAFAATARDRVIELCRTSPHPLCADLFQVDASGYAVRDARRGQ